MEVAMETQRESNSGKYIKMKNRMNLLGHFVI